MGAAQTQKKKPNFDTVWAVLQEVAEKQKEDRDDFNKRFGEITNRFGEIVEYMVAPNLQEKFKDLGFIFQRVSNDSKFSDFGNNKFQVDIMLENGQKAMLVEVKSKLSNEDVKDHIERLEKMRKYADTHDDKRTFLGAVAGVIIPSNVKDYALNKGLFIIEPSGETFNITTPGNNIREW